MERYHMYKLGVAILFYAAYYSRPLAVHGLSTNRQDRSNDEIVYYQGVQGKPGVDFPIFARIPRTTFNCKEVASGYYADLETDCQVFHICNDGAKISFLCPNGTIFQQSDLICEWWFKVNCTNSPSLYEESAEQLREETIRRKSLRKVYNEGQSSTARKNRDQTIAPSSGKKQLARTNGRHADRNQDKEIIRIKQIPARRKENKAPEQSSEETQIPEETASYFNNNNNNNKQNAIRTPIKTTTVTYANHRATYSDIQDPTYYHPKLNSHTISPISPQTYSTNQVPLNNGRPYVVTTPKSIDRKTYSPSITEAFKYSPTVPPFTTTKKPATARSTQKYNQQSNGYKFNNYDNSGHTYFDDANRRTTDFVRNVDQSPSTSPQPSINSNQRSKSNGHNFSNYHNSVQPQLDDANRRTTDFVRNVDQSKKFDANIADLPSTPQSLIDSKSKSDRNRPNFDDRNQRTTDFVRNGDQIQSKQFSAKLPDLPATSPQSLIDSYHDEQFEPNKFNNYDRSVQPQFDDVNRRTTDLVRNVPSTPQSLIDSKSKSDRNRPNFDDRNQRTTDFVRNVDQIQSKQFSAKLPDLPATSPQSLIDSNHDEQFEPNKYNNYDNFGQANVGDANLIRNVDLPTTSPQSLIDLKSRLPVSVPTASNVHRQISRESVTGDLNSPGDLYRSNQKAQNGVDKNATTKAAHSSHYCSIAFDSDQSNHTHAPTTESTSGTRRGSAVPDHQIVIGRPKINFDSFSPPTKAPNVIKINLSSNRKATAISKPSTTKPDIFRINLNENTNGFYVTNRRGSETVTPSSSSRGSTAANTYLPKISTITSTPSSFEDNSISFDVNGISSTPWSKADVNVREFSTEPQLTNSNTYLPKIASSPRSIDLPKSDLTSSGVVAGIEAPHGPILKPKPFELPPKEVGETSRLATASPDPIPNYEVSSARPFGFEDRSATVAPTQPTYTTDSSTYDHLNNMINTLKKIVAGTTNYTDSSRPGLVIPPSAGPQTLHSLAVYFANALDGIAAPEGAKPPIDLDETRAINELLTRSTLNRYHELFKNDEDDTDTTTVTTTDEVDLEAQHSKNPTVTPRVRQLAQVFTKALSSYLDDPDTFRKVLQEVRPTEPPPSSTERNDDDELLNYSDADIKPELPRLTTTTAPSVSPTWGYILAPKNSDGYEHNSLSSDGENLQSADSQSFVSQFNNLVKNKHFAGTGDERTLPNDHWTTSSDVAKLWQNTIYTNPVNINKDLNAATTAIVPNNSDFAGINYEVRALPKLELNSTQVHGILIDFMNSNNDSNKLQRILSKLNTTQAEFLEKMREIEQNPLTRRLILLLISECGSNITDVETRVGSENSSKLPDVGDKIEKSSSPFQTYVDRSLTDENEDTRALQLLNSLYSIASRYGK